MRALLIAFCVLVALPAAADAPPPPYSLPWQLRGVAPSSMLRLDTSTATFQDAKGNGGVTNVDLFFLSWKVRSWFAPFVRFGLVANSPPTGPDAVAATNWLVGGNFGVPLPLGFRLGFLACAALPLANGWGSINPAEAVAIKAGVLARSAMDNAMFAANDLTLIPGVDVAWIGHGVTVQVEATLLELMRVRGADADKDEYKTNFTTGVYVGYFFVKWLSAGVELRYQRWLTTPVAVAADKTGTLRDTLSIAGGLRGHFKLADGTWLRPGISYTHGLDDPMNAQSYNIVQIDLPLVFP